jgi:hypothetical protein
MMRRRHIMQSAHVPEPKTAMGKHHPAPGERSLRGSPARPRRLGTRPLVGFAVRDPGFMAECALVVVVLERHRDESGRA